MRRFLLFDPEIGKADTSLVDDNDELVPRFLRVAKKIELRITTQEDKPDRIYVPVLTLTYNDIAVPATSSPTVDDLSVRFRVSAVISRQCVFSRVWLWTAVTSRVHRSCTTWKLPPFGAAWASRLLSSVQSLACCFW